MGSGLSDYDKDMLREKLEGNWVEADPKGRNVPRCYTIRGVTDERPDLWVRDPFKSVVLQVRCHTS